MCHRLRFPSFGTDGHRIFSLLASSRDVILMRHARFSIWLQIPASINVPPNGSSALTLPVCWKKCRTFASRDGAVSHLRSTCNKSQPAKQVTSLISTSAANYRAAFTVTTPREASLIVPTDSSFSIFKASSVDHSLII